MSSSGIDYWIGFFDRVVIPARAGRRHLRHLAEAALLFPVIGLFACLPVDWASVLGGWIARSIGPRTAMSRRTLANLQRALPGNDAAENARIILAMWDNLGRSVAEYPHLAWICAPRSGRVEIVNGEC